MRLSYKLVVPIITGYFTIAILVHFLWMPNLLSDDKQYFMASQKKIIESLIPELNRSLLSGDLLTLHEFLDAQMEIHTQSWIAVKVKQSSGNTIYPFEEVIYTANNGMSEIIKPLIYSGKALGTLYVIVDWSDRHLTISQKLNLLEFYILFIFGVVVLTNIIWQRYQIRRPLLALTHAAAELAKGNYDVAHLNISNDEIGELSHTFQQMAEKRHENEQSLKEKQFETQEALDELAKQQYALDQHAVVSIANLKGVITFANKKFSEVSGYSNEELVGKDHRILNSGRHSDQFFSDMYSTISAGDVWHNEAWIQLRSA